MIGWTLLGFCSVRPVSRLAGVEGLVFFLLQAFFVACSLGIITHIEHYGLERARLRDGRYERTSHLHSWNSDYALSNPFLFHPQRHSDHHEAPHRRYQRRCTIPTARSCRGLCIDVRARARSAAVVTCLHPVLGRWRVPTGANASAPSSDGR